MTRSSEYATPQEELWAGAHTEAYIDRNSSPEFLAAKTALFATILAHAGGVKSVIEFGPNIGLNLQAIRALRPAIEMTAVEISPVAAKALAGIDGLEVLNQSMLEFDSDDRWDLALTMGLLIHINPSRLKDAYEVLYRASTRYICMAEYYSPSPLMVPHRGMDDQMFKRDFAGEFMAQFPDVVLREYGFVYRRDPVFPLDDVTWFLLEKRGHG